MKRTALLILLIVLVFVNQPRLSAQETEIDPHLASPDRMDLVIPDEIWLDVLAKVGHEGRPYGYTSDEMINFGVGTSHILRNVQMLFRDVTSIPQFSGRMGNLLLANPDNFASSTFNLFKLLDAYGARVMSYTLPTGWEVDWIDEEAGPGEAFQEILNLGYGTISHPIYDDDLAQWYRLPDPIKTLVVHVLIAAKETTPWILEAFDEDFYMDYFDLDDLDDIDPEDLYEFGSWPWQEYTPALAPRECFEAYDEFDIKYFATGSNEFMRMTWAAIEEFRAAMPDMPTAMADFTRCEFETPMGRVGIFGIGASGISGDYSFIFDLGGNDVYSGSTAVPRSFSKPIGVVIDLGGDDVYDSGDLKASLACGNHGIGAIFDLEGHDRYITDESGIACAWFGTGLVVDYGGDDYYYSRIFGQGSAVAGIGLLVDLGGDDYYDTILNSQGFSHTMGVGALVDVEGNDTFYADPRGYISELYEGRTVNFVQGSSQGRRADFGDGHSLGGGFGILVDGDGDDTYTGSCYAQGNAYWWAVGILEDRGGNDTYLCEQYSLGASPHFGVGCVVDLTGDDKYNVGGDPERQIQGHARDGAIAVFIDGSGNDDYLLPNLAAGSSDLNCLTLFWDRMGDDNYVADRNPPRGTAFSFGDSTRYGAFNTFRDSMSSIGIFLDTGGMDTYSENDPPDEEAAANLHRIPFGDNTEWMQRDEDPNYGYGLDISWYNGFIEEEISE